MQLPFKRRATVAQSDAIEPGALTIETVGGQAEGAVRVAGRLVIDSSPRLRATLSQLLRQRVGRVIVVDLSAATYLDTSGVATLIEAARLAHTHATRLRLTGMAGEPRMLAQVTEMDRIFLALGSEVEFR
jgi:anti-sigma B factor antagonist